MAGKKKGKANRLARMSEEEKVRYLQQRAAIEEEARRRKEQLISTFMKNKLKREDMFSRLNSAKINQQWRQTLRQIKNNELHEAAETLHQTFDVAVHTKNKIIETLLADLGNSVAMHNLAVQTHLEFMNKIIGISEVRIDNLQKSFKSCRQEELKHSKIAMERGQLKFKADEENLKSDLFWQNKYHQKNAERIESLAENYRNDYKYKVLSELKREEEESEKKVSLLQNEIKDTLKNYKLALSPFIEHYKQLKESDAKDMVVHKANIETIKELQCEIRKAEQLYSTIKDHLKGMDEKFNTLITEKKRIFDNLRTKLKEEQCRSEKAMRHLSSTSGAAINKLKSFSETLNMIINTKEIYQKYLTEKEKHITFQDLPPEEILKDITQSFWKRICSVADENKSLSAQQANLIDENMKLKHSLTKYMNTLAKPSSLTSCIYRDKALSTK